ncbi:hypothetical protein ACXYMX_11090 [Sporosarcina sp. CAU 1771]
MNNVREHVENLFSKYPKTDETRGLKDEVIGNVEAEIEDLQRNGISFEEAFRVSIGKVSGLGELITGVNVLSLRKTVLDMYQWALLYIIIAWVITIPLSVFNNARRVSWLLFIVILLMGTIYFLLYLARHQLLKGHIHTDFTKIGKLKKIVWIVWFGFQLISWGIVTLINFGSDIWFSRRISLGGPYSFGILVIQYSLPLLTIVIPLLVNKLESYVEQHEGEELHEA